MNQTSSAPRPDPLALLWFDIETTGLSPVRDSILEVAMMVAPFRKPTTITEGFCGVRHWSPTKVAHQDVSQVVREMHEKSGLWADCFESANQLFHLEDSLLSLVPETEDKEARPVLAGNSVHFDLSFVRLQMPRLAARLSHRVYDVSALSLFCRSLGMPPLPKEEAHRAEADIKASIVQWRACADWLFLNPPIPSRY